MHHGAVKRRHTGAPEDSNSRSSAGVASCSGALDLGTAHLEVMPCCRSAFFSKPGQVRSRTAGTYLHETRAGTATKGDREVTSARKDPSYAGYLSLLPCSPDFAGDEAVAAWWPKGIAMAKEAAMSQSAVLMLVCVTLMSAVGNSLTYKVRAEPRPVFCVKSRSLLITRPARDRPCSTATRATGAGATASLPTTTNSSQTNSMYSCML